ncbi:hypothetical protein TRIP_B80017 [uncultured Desulfatiglans sp.]|nr:hypothetical protein TRIP_B80017 [uncultured Desulfatiglans sp.]
MLLTDGGAELSGLGYLAGLAVKGVDQISFHLALNDPVRDTNRQEIAVDVLRRVVKGDAGDDDPLFPPLDRVDHIMADQPFQHLVVGFEYQVFEAGAEFRAHEAFARPGAENLDDAFVNVFVFPGCGRGDLGSARASLETKREFQTFAEKVQTHQSHSSQMIVD